MTVFHNKHTFKNLRKCQQDALISIHAHYDSYPNERNIIIQLPTGAGKSVLIATIPFNLSKSKVLIITPNLNISDQIEKDLDITNPGSIYEEVLKLPQSEMKNLFVLKLNKEVSKKDIDEHQILIANYHQLYEIERWFDDNNIIDLIIIDEAHHQEAATYREIINHFPRAKIIGLTATPFRADGKAIEGKTIFSYSFEQAIKDGIIRNISSTNISQETISLIFSDNEKRELSLKDILEMKEERWFNCGVALSVDCCDLIAAEAAEKRNELNKEFPNDMHQIIAVAMSKRHAREVVKTSFEKLGLLVGIVSSDENDKRNNESTLVKLKKGRIQVIITIGMLGEGFNQPSLGVAAIFRPFKTLNPYIQFIGRVMRVNGVTNKSFVVSHVGLNQVSRFAEFKLFDSNDQKFISSMLEIGVTNSFDTQLVTGISGEPNTAACKIRQTGDLTITLTEYFSAWDAAKTESVEQQTLSKQLGINIPPEIKITTKVAQSIKPITKRKAARKQLHESEKSIVKDILVVLGLDYSAKTLTSKYNNFAWIKKKVSAYINNILNIQRNQRKEITNDQYRQLELDGSLNKVKEECCNYFIEKLKIKRNLIE